MRLLVYVLAFDIFVAAQGMHHADLYFIGEGWLFICPFFNINADLLFSYAHTAAFARVGAIDIAAVCQLERLRA